MQDANVAAIAPVVQLGRPPLSKKRGPPAALRLEPSTTSNVVADVEQSIAPDQQPPPPSLPTQQQQQPPLAPAALPQPPKPNRNMKRLSLSIHSASTASNTSLPSSPISSVAGPTQPTPGAMTPAAQVGPSAASLAQRRASVASLPGASAATILHRTKEGDSPSAPYMNGPIEIIPRVWLGSEDNARDWQGLIDRNIRSVLNVAKEVASPYEAPGQHQLRSFVSTPNLVKAAKGPPKSTYQPAHIPTGRPAMHYLKLPWSHGQADLVTEGFPAAMAFVDDALKRGDGVLVHCQCGISRSATMVIALVMREAASNSIYVPAEVAALKGSGMHGAYAYVKEKSSWVGPNMSLIYQLMEYERELARTSLNSLRAAAADARVLSEQEQDEEWARRRREMDEDEEDDRSPMGLMRKEARDLDREMEQRYADMAARKNSATSTTSSLGQPLPNAAGAPTVPGASGGLAPSWRTHHRFPRSRSRTGSVGSNNTTRSTISSTLSEDPLEEDEDADAERSGSGRTAEELRTPNTDGTDDDVHHANVFADKMRRGSVDVERNSDDGLVIIPAAAPATLVSRLEPPGTALFGSFASKRLGPPGFGGAGLGLRPPPSAPPTKQSFAMVLPPKRKEKRRPPPLLATIPPSPVATSPAGPGAAAAPAPAASSSQHLLPPPPTLGVPKPPTTAAIAAPAPAAAAAPILAPPPRAASPSGPPRLPPAAHSRRRPAALALPNIHVPRPNIAIASGPNTASSSQSHRSASSRSTAASDRSGASASTGNGGSVRSGASLASSRGSQFLAVLQPPLPAAQTPSQTLFVFPPEPTSTPSALMLTSTTPLLSAFLTPKPGSIGRRSWINTGAPTPTTATARVDAKGWFGRKGS